MANKTVSNLKEVTTVSNSDVLLVETSTETLKVTKGNLLKEVNEELNAKSDANHTHDEYVTESELNSKGLATEMFVTNKIAEAQLGNDGGNMDLSGYATTEYVDQEVGKTNAQLSKVAEQKLDKNGIVTMVNMGQDVKEAITGGSVAVVGRDMVGNENVKDYSISKSKLNFMEIVSNNLFDKNNIDRSGYYYFDGQFKPSSNYFHSGFIKVEPNEVYCDNISGFHVGWDINKNVIGEITKVGSVFTTPTECHFVTIAVPLAMLGTAQLNIGDTLLTYDECRYKDSTLEVKLEDIKDLNDLNITSEKVDFLVKKIGVNKFNKEAVIKDSYYHPNTGKLTDYVGYNASDFIPVEPNVTYKWISIGHTCFWDANKKFISGFSGKTEIKITDTNIKFITISVPSSNLENEMFVEGDKIPSNYIPYTENYVLDEDIIIKKNSINEAVSDILSDIQLSSKLHGLKWNVLGDSITSTNYANKRYWEYIAEKNNMIVNNYGISGSRIAVWEGHEYPMCIRYSDMSDDADIITVFGGTNDFSDNVTLGDINSEDTGTFYGALNVLCKGLSLKYKGKRIGFFTPMQRRWHSPTSEKWLNYQNAIKEVCAKYSIPVLDLNFEGGLAIGVIDDIATAYTIDGLHPNDEGHKVLSRRIEQFIESL